MLDDKLIGIATRLGDGDMWAGIRIALHLCEQLSYGSAEPRADARVTASRKFAKENPDYIIDRETARSLGFTLYRTGLPCRRGHTAWRYVSTGNCIECLEK